MVKTLYFVQKVLYMTFVFHMFSIVQMDDIDERFIWQGFMEFPFMN